MNKFFKYIIISTLLCTAIGYHVAAQDVVFTDIDQSTPEGQAIYKMAELGYVKGMPDSTFQPNNSLTRAQLVRMVNQVFHYEEKGTNVFNDVKEDQWFYNDIIIAQKVGYIKGMGGGTFRPDNKVTREQVCIILNGIMNFEPLPIDRQISDPISAWAKDSVNKLIANRVFLLDAENRFRATEPITRQEVCAVLVKFITNDILPQDTSFQDAPSDNKDITTEELTRRMNRVVNSLETKVIPIASTDAIKSITQIVSDNMKAYIADNNYDYKIEAKKTYELYNKLSTDEKKELKKLVQENNWTDDLIMLYDFFFQ